MDMLSFHADLGQHALMATLAGHVRQSYTRASHAAGHVCVPVLPIIAGSAATKQGADLPAVEDQTQAPAPVSNAAMAGTRLLHEQVLGGRKTGATLKTRR